MRSSLFIIFSSAILFLLSGCGFSLFEEAELKLPEIEILSVSQEGASTLVVIEVFAGSSIIEFIGFSYSEEENFSVIDNQNLYGVPESGVYELSLDGLSPERTYYFRAFVGQELAYVESQTVSFFVPRPLPPVIPCAVVLNQIRDRGATFNQPLVTANDGSGGGSQYGLRIDCGIGGGIITLSFLEVPTSGVYQTSTFSGLPLNTSNVFISYSTGFQQGTAQVDQPVYVEKTSEQDYLISFCDMEYTLGGSTVFSFTGQVRVQG